MPFRGGGLRLAHQRFPIHRRAMDKLCIFVGTVIGGYLFWYVGDLLGFEFLGCFLLSGLGSMVGVFAGWKFAQQFK